MKLKITATYTDGRVDVLDVDLAKYSLHVQLLQSALKAAARGEAVLVVEKGTE